MSDTSTQTANATETGTRPKTIVCLHNDKLDVMQRVVDRLHKPGQCQTFSVTARANQSWKGQQKQLNACRANDFQLFWSNEPGAFRKTTLTKYIEHYHMLFRHFDQRTIPSILDITFLSDTKILFRPDIGTFLSTVSENLVHSSIQLCTLGIKHSDNQKPLGYTHHILHNSKASWELAECKCGQPSERHYNSKPSMHLTSKPYLQASMMILLLYDVIPRQRDTSQYDLKQIEETVGQCIRDAAPSVRKAIQSWLESSQSGRPQACSPADDEIHPETSEVEVYPTDARIRQKEKHKHFKEVTGEKHKPKKKQKVIHPGKDDCGEDFSSMGDLAAFTTYDTCTCLLYTSPSPRD